MEFHDEGDIGGLKGFVGSCFSNGDGLGAGYCHGYCAWGCCGVTFDDTWSVSFSLGVLGLVQSFLLWFSHCLSASLDL